MELLSFQNNIQNKTKYENHSKHNLFTADHFNITPNYTL